MSIVMEVGVGGLGEGGATFTFALSGSRMEPPTISGLHAHTRRSLSSVQAKVANRNARFGTGDRERPLNEGQRPHFRGVRVALGTGKQSRRGKSRNKTAA